MFSEQGFFEQAKFEDLAPPNQDSEEKIRKFLEILPIDRTFQILPLTEVSGSREIEPTMSGSQKSSSHFALHDIDCMLTEASSVKKEEISSKPRVLLLRSKIPPSRKKRKEADLVGSEAFPILLEFKEAMRHSQMGMEQMSRCYSEKLAEIEDMKKLAALRLKKADKDAAKIAKLEEEIESQAKKHESFLQVFSKKHAEELDELVEQAKRSAGAVILEARIKMDQEAEEKGFDVSFWDVESWKKAKANFSGKDLEEKKEEVAEKVEEDMVLDAGDEAIEPVE